MSNQKLSESEMNEMLTFLRTGKKTIGFGKALLSLIATVLIILYGFFSYGVLTYLMWYWFLIPVFPMVPAITLIQAIGLNFVIGLFKNHRVYKEDSDEDEKAISRKITMGLLPWITIGMAWIFKYFCM